MRVSIALIIFLLISLFFVDVYEWLPTQIRAYTVDVQFIPLLFKATQLSIAAILLLVVWIGLTYAYGRVYCSTVCPLGVYQDVVIRLKKWMRKKVRFRFKKALPGVHYGISALVFGTWILGISAVLLWLDPYSNFGRIMAQLVKPALVGILNFSALHLQQADVYWFHPVNYTLVPPSVVAVAIIFTGVTLLSWYRGRLFCNLLCPVGGVLSLISRFSAQQLHMNSATCTSCGKCQKSCKAECIQVKNQHIDFSRCVACYNCISVCDQQAISYKKRSHNTSKVSTKTTQQQRRTVLKETAGVALSLLSFQAFSQHRKQHGKSRHASSHFANRGIVSPPGSRSIAHFNDKCTACHLCVAKCPANILQATFMEYGAFHMLQPKMNYDIGYCNFNCTICGEVCPTGAILPLQEEEKKVCQVGKVHFEKQHCVVETDGTSCGSCSEHCPTQAVFMVPYADNLTIPEVNPDLCIGCGACEHACPVLTPHKAIYVISNAVHQVADKPKEEQVELEMEEDFPF